jgi:hypothetical protein
MNLFRKPRPVYLTLAYYLIYLTLVGALYLVNRTQGITLVGNLLVWGILLMVAPAALWIAYYRVVTPLVWLVRMCIVWSQHQRATWTLALVTMVAVWLFSAALALWSGNLLFGLLTLAAGLGLLSLAYESRVELIARLNERQRKHAHDPDRTAL